MATSQDKKRKSRSGERHESRGGGKKRREDGKSFRRSRSGRSSTAPGKKVRSISELVKLVISGEVKVPKSLAHYVEDRPQLVDQLFTILSESDVKGMLPDILKGLRMRQVKQLCLDQLKNMSTENIIEILDSQQSVRAINLDATVFELLGPPTANSNTKSSSTAVTVDSSARTSSSSGSSSKGWTRESGKTGVMCVSEGTEMGRGADGNPLGMEVESSVGVGESLKTGPRKRSGRKKGVTICISDVSGDEGKADNERYSREEVTLHDSSPTQTMECDTTTLDPSAHQTSIRPVQRDRELEQTQQERVDSDDSESTSSGSLSDLDDCWLCDFPEEVPEWARLQEIEFRRRALEAELRRADQMEVEDEEREGGGEEEVRREERGSGGEGKRDVVPTLDPPSRGADEKIDKLEALELQLRQRALQSLLAKKKEQKL